MGPRRTVIDLGGDRGRVRRRAREPPGQDLRRQPRRHRRRWRAEKRRQRRSSRRRVSRRRQSRGGGADVRRLGVDLLQTRDDQARFGQDESTSRHLRHHVDPPDALGISRVKARAKCRQPVINPRRSGPSIWMQSMAWRHGGMSCAPRSMPRAAPRARRRAGRQAPPPRPLGPRAGPRRRRRSHQKLRKKRPVLIARQIRVG